MPLLRVISLGRFLILMLSVSEPSVSLRAAAIGNAKVELDATSKVLFEPITALSIISDELTAASSRLATARLSLASVSS
jgi:hypothetical protein